MPPFEPVSTEQLLKLPPMIFGVIRWKKFIGRPSTDLCSGFNIRVEEHTATQFRAVGGGKYEPIPGTGIWKDVADCVSCRELPDEGDYHKLSLQIWGPGIHLNALPDGHYRITPTLKGIWGPAGLVVLSGYRTIDPWSWRVVLNSDNHIQSVEFEVVQRRRFFGAFFGTMMGAVTLGAMLGLLLKGGKPNTSSSRQLTSGVLASIH